MGGHSLAAMGGTGINVSMRAVSSRLSTRLDRRHLVKARSRRPSQLSTAKRAVAAVDARLASDVMERRK
jgi:hypothetical protein